MAQIRTRFTYSTRRYRSPSDATIFPFIFLLVRVRDSAENESSTEPSKTHGLSHVCGRSSWLDTQALGCVQSGNKPSRGHRGLVSATAGRFGAKPPAASARSTRRVTGVALIRIPVAERMRGAPHTPRNKSRKRHLLRETVTVKCKNRPKLDTCAGPLSCWCMRRGARHGAQ